MLQLLPINEMAPGQQSPYSAISAMAIDPIFITVPGVPEFAALGGEDALGDDDRAALVKVRHAARIDYAEIRRLKKSALRMAFSRFLETDWCRDTSRSRQLKAFLSEQAWWVEDYALFRAIHAREGERPWTQWPDALQRREPADIDHARRELSREVLFQQYLQWIADAQWKDVRTKTHGVQLFGDLPFMVDGDSADVWSRQDQFRLDASLGVPPDAFSATGQDWGMPVYRWDVIAAQDFRWLRERARRSADLYDGYRVDHLVGFYRTYGRPRNGGDPFFTPAHQGEQEVLGEYVLGILRGAGAEIIAEDLGTVPDFVRGSLARLGVPGFRVFRWERHWHGDGQPFREPADYPPTSVAASGTHDTEPLVVWWRHAPEDERRKVNAIGTIQRLTNGTGILRRRRANGSRRDSGDAVCIGIESAVDAGAGRLRVARSHQSAGDRHRRQLDVPPAVAERPPRRGRRSARAPGDAAPLDGTVRTAVEACSCQLQLSAVSFSAILAASRSRR